MPPRSARTFIGGCAVLALVAPGLLSATAAPAVAASTGASTAPVYAHDFPDPSVIFDPSTARYYAYSTGSATTHTQLQVMSSTSPTTWAGPPVEALPVLPTWASPGSTWAPAVIKIGSSFVMYYTVRDTSLSKQCVSVATSSTPGGPFSDGSTGPLVCDAPGSIDPSPFVGPGGSLTLVWKSDDNAVGLPTNLWSRPLAAGGLSFAATASTLLLSASAPWQSSLIEGPSMVAVPNSTNVDLFYGANAWDSSKAGIGYAVCSSPAGPCTNQSTTKAWMATNARLTKNGPSGPSVFTDASGNPRLAYHAWGATIGYPAGARQLWIDTLSFSGSTPSIP